MKLVDTCTAAEIMDIPVCWLNGMIKQGRLIEYIGDNATRLIDSEEIISNHYCSAELPAPSLAHVQSMLRKFAANSDENLTLAAAAR